MSSSITARDQSNPNHYVEIVEFPSYEEAMRNNALPETQQIAERMQRLCTRPIAYVDLDEVRRETG